MVVPDAIPPVDIAGGSGQEAVQAEDAIIEKKKDQGKGKRTSTKAKDPAKESVTEDLGADSQAKDVPPSQPEQKEDPPVEAQFLGFSYCIFFFEKWELSYILFFVKTSLCTTLGLLIQNVLFPISLFEFTTDIDIISLLCSKLTLLFLQLIFATILKILSI